MSIDRENNGFQILLEMIIDSSIGGDENKLSVSEGNFCIAHPTSNFDFDGVREN